MYVAYWISGAAINALQFANAYFFTSSNSNAGKVDNDLQLQNAYSSTNTMSGLATVYETNDVQLQNAYLPTAIEESELSITVVTFVKLYNK